MNAGDLQMLEQFQSELLCEVERVAVMSRVALETRDRAAIDEARAQVAIATHRVAECVHVAREVDEGVRAGVNVIAHAMTRALTGIDDVLRSAAEQQAASGGSRRELTPR